MKQNNKSIFSPSSSNENSPSDANSCKGLSTPVTRNPDISNIRRRHLPLDNAEKEVSDSGILDPSTPVRRQTVIVGYKDGQLSSPTGSTNSPESNKQESPRSAEIAMMTAKLTMAEKDMGSPAKFAGNINEEKQKSLQSADKTGITYSPGQEDKNSRSPIQDDQMPGNSTETDFLNPEENARKFDNSDSSNKDSVICAEGMAKISKPTIVESETPSPVKRPKTSSISALDVENFESPTDKVRTVESSSKGKEATVSPIQGGNKNLSPNEACKGIGRGELKRKSPSPRKKNETVFSLIPRVIQSGVEAEMGIEVSSHLEDKASPSPSQSSSADNKRGSIKDVIKCPVASGSKTGTTPSILERYLRFPERALNINSYCNASGSNSPGNYDDIFAGKYPSDIPSTSATTSRDMSCKFESSSADIETDPALMKQTILKFQTLLVLRDQVSQKFYCSLLSFQNATELLSSYIQNVAVFLLKIGFPGQEYSTKELYETVGNGSSVTLKLGNKLKSWKTDVDLDVEAWNNCLQQIQQLKAQYEPLLTNEGKPAVTFDVVQVYEYELKAIWKRMDDMMMMADSRRALFSQIAYDVGNLIKILVKCLILVGILLPR